MDPFAHLYLDVKSEEDTLNFMNSLFCRLSSTPMNVQKNGAGTIFSFSYGNPLNGEVRCVYCPETNRLDVLVSCTATENLKEAESVFKKIEDYVRETREPGTYEIAPEV